MITDSALPMKMPTRVNWCWRLLMTGCCLVLFSLGGLLLSLIGFNVLLLIQRDQRRRRYVARRTISGSFRFLLRIAKRVGVLDYHITGAELLCAERGCLIVANHPTLIDYLLLASVMPDVDCLVKAELLANPFINGVIRAAGYLQNSQADTLLPDSQQRLAAGDNILIFPEGTRSQPGKPLVLQRGAANIALRNGCDLRVVHIRCSQPMLSKHNKWYRIPRVKPVFSVEVGEQITINNFITDKDNVPAQAVRRLTQYLTQLLTPDNGKPSGN